MITGAHSVIFADDADAARRFVTDVLGWPAVDAGGGWLLFAMPPAELGFHPTGDDAGTARHELYLMCDDIDATVKELTAKGVEFTGDPTDEGFGRVAWMKVPGAGDLALYEPNHPTAVSELLTKADESTG